LYSAFSERSPWARATLISFGKVGVQFVLEKGDFVLQLFLNFFGKINHFSGRLEGLA